MSKLFHARSLVKEKEVFRRFFKLESQLDHDRLQSILLRLRIPHLEHVGFTEGLGVKAQGDTQSNGNKEEYPLTVFLL